jgi:O-antigen ligase
MRVNSDDQSYNSIGQSAVYAIIAALLLLHDLDKKKKVYWIAIMLNIYLIIVSGSRKSILYLFFVWVGMYILSSTNIIKTLIKIFAILVICFIGYRLVIGGVLGDGLQNLVASLQGFGDDSSVVGRLAQIDRQWELFFKRPFRGYGIGMVEWYCRNILGQTAVVADCDYLDILVDLGVVGIVIFYGMHLFLFFKYLCNIKKWQYKDRLLFVWLLLIFINGYVCRTYFNNYFIFLYIYVIYRNVADRLDKNSKIVKIVMR